MSPQYFSRQAFRLPYIALGVLFCMLYVSSVRAADEKQQALQIGQVGPAINLGDYRGKSWAWEDLAGKQVTVVAFLGTECPLVKLYSKRLEAMAKQFGPQGVKFVGVNSNQHDSLAEIAHFVRSNELTFPMLKDPGNRIADAYGAERTPEMFVLDHKGRLQYRGRIDDQYTYGLQKPKVTRSHLQAAIKALLNGKQVVQPVTETVGCHIGRLLKPDPTSKVTYSNQISRILQKRCVSCHRSGELAPFALSDYDEVVGWAEMIAEVVEERRMPPWHANPKHGKFANDASLSKKEIEQLLAWVDAGAPEGDPKLLPAPLKFEPGWRIGKPDLIVKMSKKPFRVPAEGEVRYQNFVADYVFEKETWIKAAECRPGNPNVVHHILVTTRSPRGGRQADHSGPNSAWLAATAPGASPLNLADGMAKRIPAGSRLHFQMHYTPNGVAQDDLSSIGLIFADPKTVKQEVFTQQAANTQFVIPAGADNHPVKARTSFRRDTLLLTLFPHMHLRGKSFRYTLTYPDGREQILLDVPAYDFNWQTGYRLEKPLLIPAGSQLLCTAHFDNSEDNLANPDPQKRVRWGDQTWEEMMIGYFDICLADQDLTDPNRLVRRTDAFLNRIKKTPFNPRPLSSALWEGLESQDALADYGKRLQQQIPQLDRMDWSFVDGDRLRVHRVVQSSGPAVASRPLTIQARGTALAYYAEKGQTVVNQKLAGIRNPDMHLMSRYFKSSLHIPTERNGKPGLISFWSEEPNAFPAQVVQALEAVVQDAKAR